MHNGNNILTRYFLKLHPKPASIHFIEPTIQQHEVVIMSIQTIQSTKAMQKQVDLLFDGGPG